MLLFFALEWRQRLPLSWCAESIFYYKSLRKFKTKNKIFPGWRPHCCWRLVCYCVFKLSHACAGVDLLLPLFPLLLTSCLLLWFQVVSCMCCCPPYCCRCSYCCWRPWSSSMVSVSAIAAPPYAVNVPSCYWCIQLIWLPCSCCRPCYC